MQRLANGTSTLKGALDSEDTRVMIAGLRALGIEVDSTDDGKTLVVHGANRKIPAMEADLDCANSGTTIRFLTAMASLGHGAFRLDGVARMRARPIGDLLAALNQLGTNASCENDNDCPPVLIHANGLPGGEATIRGDVSSQYLSAILMASPYADSSVEIKIDGKLVSKPYVAMTLAVMNQFGSNIETDFRASIRIGHEHRYAAQEYAIEPDASAASYFWAAAAITGGEVAVQGLSERSLQGDVGFVRALAQMGCDVDFGDNEITVRGRELKGIDVNMNAISDTAQTLAAVALFANGPTRIRGIAHNRHKETDRIGNLAIELRKLGAQVDEHEDGFTIVPRALSGTVVETYNDHRMAMSLALAGLKIPNVQISNPSCTEKTYPYFFEDLEALAQS